MTPTPEQLEIVRAARDTEDNLLISALAGAAKTSTLVLVAKALPSVHTLCLAFNKKIAMEMSQRLPGNCESMTLNSIGHRALSKMLGKRLVLNTKKVFSLTKEYVDASSAKQKEILFEEFSNITQAVSSGKTAGYIPDDISIRNNRLMDDDDFYNWLDERPSDLVFHAIRTVSKRSIEQSFQAQIDFDDQILMPTVFPASFPSFPLVLVDEAQDLSSLNHQMLQKIVRKRLIAVGDECQAIYGFRGAHEESMTLLQQAFNMKRKILSISFRCPQAVVFEAQWRAPHMQFPEWAKAGEVRQWTKWSAADLPENATIICRNNSPLFYMAIRLLKNGRRPQLIGNDISKFLVKILKGLGPAHMRREEALVNLEAWKAEKLTRVKDAGKVHDQVECIKIFLNQGETISDALVYAEYIFNMQGPISLMTGHKSKGLEYDDVFILDRHLLDTKGKGQDKNLLYVMQTRAKSTLTYIETDNMLEVIDDE